MAWASKRTARRATADVPTAGEGPRVVRRVAKRRKKWTPDYERFRRAAGSWKDVDTDKLIKDIYEGRAVGWRPPVDL